jgi:peptidoglycan/LPS O-acetylase OafA/YrhL
MGQQEPPVPLEQASVHRIAFIEGLRAWLAWTVVAGHIAVMSGVASYTGPHAWLPKAGSTAVQIFIVISGFVICNVIMERHESWRAFITRRFFRIFPAYLFAYGLALLIFPLALDLPPALNDPHLAHYNTLHGWANIMAEHPVSIFLLHIALLQGIVPDSVWPGTSEAVLGQAWSLTLEWQFYLIAPLVVWLLFQPRSRFVTAMVLLSSVVVFRSGLFGQFGNPSIFVAAAHLFLVGIASRLWLKDLQNFVVPPLFAACALMFGLIFREVMWLAIWVALMAYFVSKEQWRAAGYTMLLKAIHLALESPVARYMGARSYSVYLLHTSVIELTIWVIGTAKPDVMRPEIFLAVLVIAPPLIAVASDLLYRWIEHPLTLFGGRLARRKETVTKLPDKRGESLGV